jgi:hypothetical protein
MKKIIYSLLVFLLVSLACAEESIKRAEYKISEKYKGGEYLIYDCEKDFYACVNMEGYELCSTKRQAAIALKEKSYPCAPLKKFEDKKSCLLKNYSAIESGKLKRFCYPH